MVSFKLFLMFQVLIWAFKIKNILSRNKEIYKFLFYYLTINFTFSPLDDATMFDLWLISKKFS